MAEDPLYDYEVHPSLDEHSTLPSQSLDIELSNLVRTFKKLVFERFKQQKTNQKQDQNYQALGEREDPLKSIPRSVRSLWLDLHAWHDDLLRENISLSLWLKYLPQLDKPLSVTVKNRVRGAQLALDLIGEKVSEIEGTTASHPQGDAALRDLSNTLENLLQDLRDNIEGLQNLKTSILERLSTASEEELQALEDVSKGQDLEYSSILCLDGGGIRSFTTLLILKTLMERVDDARRRWFSNHPKQKDLLNSPLRPCDVFNFVFGSSSGGLIAIMLGRLEMSVDDCIQRFQSWADAIFSKPSLGWRVMGLNGLSPFPFAKYRPKTVVETTRALVDEFDESWRRNTFSNKHGKCKTGIIASQIDSDSGRWIEEKIFRSYDCTPPKARSSRHGAYEQNHGSASLAQVWEIALATTAAPGFFPSVKVGDKTFIDGGLRTNNPSFVAFEEFRSLQGDHAQGAKSIFISIGTGSIPSQFNTHLNRPNMYLLRNLRDVLTETETTHHYMQEVMSLYNPGELSYHRFSPQLSRPVRLDEWKDGGTKTLQYLRQQTEMYLDQDEVHRQLRECAAMLFERYRMRHGISDEQNVPQPLMSG